MQGEKRTKATRAIIAILNADLPTMPTQIPHTRLQNPVVRPAPNMAKPVRENAIEDMEETATKTSRIQSRRKEKGERRKEKGERRKEKGERGKEKGERRKEKGKETMRAKDYRWSGRRENRQRRPQCRTDTRTCKG